MQQMTKGQWLLIKGAVTVPSKRSGILKCSPPLPSKLKVLHQRLTALLEWPSRSVSRNVSSAPMHHPCGSPRVD